MPKKNSAKYAEKTAHDKHKNIDELVRLKLALEITKDSVWEWNIQTREIYFYNNPKFLEEFGYQTDKMPLLSELWQSRVHPEDITSVNKIFDEYYQGIRDSHEMEYRIQAKSGEWRWILSRARLIERDEDGKPLRLIGIHSDITGRKQLEEDLQESLMLFEAQFTSSPDIILIVDQDFKVVKINRIWAGNFTVDGLKGVNAIEILPPEYQVEVRHRLERCFETGEIQEFEHYIGDGKWVFARITRLTRAGRSPQLMIISSDITDRKRTLDLLRIQKDLSIVLAGATELKELGEHVLNAMVQMEGIDSGGLYIRDTETGKLNLITHIGLPESFTKSAASYGPDSAQAQIIARGERIYISYSKLNVPKDEARIKEGLKLLLVMPIKHENNVIAVLNLASHTHEDLSPAIRDSIEAVAGMLGDSVARVRTETAAREINARLRAVIESPRDISIFSLDVNFCYTSFNERHRKQMFDLYDIEIKNGMNSLDIIPVPEIRAEKKRNYEFVLKGSTVADEYDLLGIIYFVTINPIFDNSRKVIGISSFIQDINEYKLAEKKIVESEILYSTLVNALPDGLIVTDIKGCIKYMSLHAQNILGIDSPENAIGRSVLEFVAPEDIEKFRTNFQNLLQYSLMHIKEYALLKNDGMHFEAEIHASVIRDASGNINGVIGVIHDITKRREMEEKIRQAEKMEAIGQLAGGIAHDFNNELSIIQGNTELLRYEVGSDPEQLSFVDNILKGIKRSSDLVARMLAFSRRGKFLLAPVNINDIILEIINMLQHSIDKRIIIRKKLNANPAITLGDPSQLKSAILNLALNARDAMPDGGRVSFATEVVDIHDEKYKGDPYNIDPGKYIMISVTDTGIGMDNEIQSHIFEPFFTTKDKSKGSGMGLASVYGTVKNHKGMISVNSELGSGSTIKLYLPLAEHACPVPEEADIKTDMEKSMDVSANILLVEDEDDLRTIAKKMLVKLGHKVSVCKDGREGVKFYKKNWQKTDIVILDMVMPVMNGGDAFIAMQKINPGIKALLISGYSLNGEAQAILDKGVMGFLQKPFKKNELSNKISDVLEA